MSAALHPEQAPARSPPTAPAPGQGSQRLLGWLMRMLDEIDYGVLLVSATDRVLYMNQTARLKLDDSHPLLLHGEVLHPRHSADAAVLQAALAGARAGRRKLVSLGDRAQGVMMSVVPLEGGPGGPGLEGATLLVMGKQAMCEPLSVQGYARSLALTPAETRVLVALCEGIGPSDLAQLQGVALSTIRSQITAIRHKTGTNSIREMVQKVARLPPLVGALRTRPASADSCTERGGARNWDHTSEAEDGSGAESAQEGGPNGAPSRPPSGPPSSAPSNAASSTTRSSPNTAPVRPASGLVADARAHAAMQADAPLDAGPAGMAAHRSRAPGA